MATPKLFSLACVAASFVAISAPAMAETSTVEVKYSDLDLSTAKGQDRLKTRVKQAVKQVCVSPRAITISDRLDQMQCEKTAMTKAMPKAERQIASYMANRRVALGQ
ncbi:MAG: UrcA family protein [Sphingorhabdus sp.]|uniref:UrcA family protein n=1 Tax=Sphingorhabdus sp. TaxID=1902408 RepID=UPI0038FD0200